MHCSILNINWALSYPFENRDSFSKVVKNHSKRVLFLIANDFQPGVILDGQIFQFNLYTVHTPGPLLNLCQVNMKQYSVSEDCTLEIIWFLWVLVQNVYEK